MRIAYIVSRYPLLSHVFILREVLALRRAGATIDTYTVRRPSTDDLRTPEDHDAYSTTTALVPPAFGELLSAHTRALVTRPRRYFATLRRAIALRAPGTKAALWQLFYFGEAVLLWNRCRAQGTRHIHAHHADVASDVALLAITLGGGDWSWSFTLHGPTEFFEVAAHRLPQKAELAKFVVCISHYARSQVMGLVPPEHWPKLRVVRCSVDLERFPAIDRGARTRAVEILSVGRAVPVKGQALLVEAVADLKRRGVEARLTIVGDGPALGDLRALAAALAVADSVSFEGAVGQEQILGYYESADVFALPSFAEGIPVVLMEAMATGLPVVSTTIAGIPELVDDGASGFLVTPGRVDELAGALERVLAAGAEERAEMGRVGRERVESEFATVRVAERLLELFREQAAVPCP